MSESSFQIEPYDVTQLEAVVALSLRAWAPVFVELERLLDSDVYAAFYPQGWQVSQQHDVRTVCTSGQAHVWVAREAERVVGFVAVKCTPETTLGELHMLAVDPPHQRRGIGRALTEFAVAWMRSAGISVAMVETGGDPGHAPARQTYERAGFRLLPVSRYFMKL